MTKLRICGLLLLMLFTFCFSSAQSETNIRGNLSFIKLGNGLSVVVSTNNSLTKTEITCYIKTGSMYDPDSMSGCANILQHIISSKIKLWNAGLSLQHPDFSSFTTSEHSVFKFSITTENINTLLSALSQYVFSAKITEQELQAAIYQVKQEIANDSLDARMVFNNKIMQAVFRKDFAKLNATGNVARFENISLKTITDMYHRYYVPNNALFAVSGNVTYTAFRQYLQGDLNAVLKSDFDPETISKIVDLRPMIYTTHFVFETETPQPEFNLCWQFPGAVTNTESSYSAYLLSAMLNDKNNFIQKKAAKLGCKKFAAQYEANNFSGMLRIVIQPDKANLIATLNLVTTEMGRLEQTLINESMINAGKLQFQRELTALQNAPDYPEWVVRYWAYKDDSYFTELLDTVMGVKEHELRKFAAEYLSRAPHVTGLYISKADRNELNVDSLFTDVNELVGDYVFSYRPNICDLEGAQNFTMQRNLLQFLKANSDVNLQVNGLADEGEFNQAVDDSIRMFIDSLPTFRKTMPEKVKKGYLRPEMMRAMKMLKYFYDNGIEAERLSGTSMKFSSKTEAEEAENMKCTVTLDKLRRAPSVYEFHYGKKKQ